MAASLTLRVIMPGTSMELTNGMRPCRDNRPYVGFKATTPHSAPGLRVEPPVSEPRALPSITKTVHFDLIQIFLFFGTVFVSQWMCSLTGSWWGRPQLQHFLLNFLQWPPSQSLPLLLSTLCRGLHNSRGFSLGQKPRQYCPHCGTNT